MCLYLVSIGFMMVQYTETYRQVYNIDNTVCVVLLIEKLFCDRISFCLLVQAIYDMLYMLTAIGLTPGDSSTVHIYTQKQYIEQHN